jgi:putative transposase
VKRPTPELLDISRWPSVDVNALEEKARLRYQQRAAAVEHYAAGAPLGVVESKTEIHRRVLYRMIERALQAHRDGRPRGFRALVPGSQTKAYERSKASKSLGVGLAGAFNQLLDRQPKLEELVRQLIVSCDIRLVQQGERVYLKNLRNAHNRFMAACRSLGLRGSDYPPNQKQQGLRSLGAVLRERMMQEFKETHRSAGGERVKPAAALAERPTAPVRDPFDTVEFDAAHRLDLRLKILEIERAWLLALIDVGTRAILGYTLCLRREYSRYDVIRTFETALAPASMPTLRSPGSPRSSAVASSRSRYRKTPTRAGGAFVLITPGRTWPGTASKSLASYWVAPSRWALPIIPTNAHSSGVSSARSRRASAIACPLRLAPDRTTSYEN